ncbi:MAG: PepSY-like domain-containing protein [Thermoflavifilum sp.]|nr:PepSY-like domain-containing protein [Thermoflavifilum sp.]
MKQKFLFMALSAFIAFPAFAQRIPASKVPAAAVSAFHQRYANVSHEFWEKEGKNFEANWKENGFDHSAVFTPSGQFVSAETDIPVDQLPEAVRQYAMQHHLTIHEASINEDAQGKKTYEADVAHGKALIFDASGKYLKTVKGD